MQKLKKNKGITLIAFVITIIVLIDLSTITIAMIANTGIVYTTENTTDNYTQQSEKNYKLK